MVGVLLDWARRELAATSVADARDAEILLAHFSGMTRAAVLARPERVLDPDPALGFLAAIGRRATGEPVAYLTGTREFYSLPLGVSPAVLVPRPETEILVEASLRFLAGQVPDARSRRADLPKSTVLDLGTGSGAIALALKSQRPDLDVTATDKDRAALDVARDNATALGIEVRFVESDWFSGFSDERFELIVANPPYVPSNDPHFAGPLRHEPRSALDGGADGLDAIREILGQAPTRLAPGAHLLLEHGYDQRAAVADLARVHGFEVVEVIDDLAGLARAIVLRCRRNDRS
jgi:release factor glutamine methyltransferase